jgi:hypothetical protein
MRQAARLPAWARMALCMFWVWPCVVVPRWRLFLGLGVLTAAGLTAARWYYEVDDLTWGAIAGLSTIHVWFPLVILAPLMLPYTLLAGLLLLAADWHRRRGERAQGKPGPAPDSGRR